MDKGPYILKAGLHLDVLMPSSFHSSEGTCWTVMVPPMAIGYVSEDQPAASPGS